METFEIPKPSIRDYLSYFFIKYKKRLIISIILLILIITAINVFFIFKEDIIELLPISESSEAEIQLNFVQLEDLKRHPSNYADTLITVSGLTKNCTYILTEASNITSSADKDSFQFVAEDLIEKEYITDALCLVVYNEDNEIKIPTTLYEISNISEGEFITVSGYLAKASRLSDVLYIEQIVNDEYLKSISVISDSKINNQLIELKIHELVNKKRAGGYLPSLIYNQNLANIARFHSQNMKEGNFFESVDLNGRDASDRAEALGYYCLTPQYTYSHQFGENLFQNWLYDSIEYSFGIPKYNWITEEEIANTTFHEWILDKQNLASILAPNYTYHGLGISVTDDNKVLITQNFC